MRNAYAMQGLSLKLASGKDKDGEKIPVLTIPAPTVPPSPWKIGKS